MTTENNYTDVDYFIMNIDILIDEVRFFDDLFCNEDSINVINRVSIGAFNIIKNSLHDKIISSLVSCVYVVVNYFRT